MAVKYQMIGLLSKRPFGRQANAWSKRFFVIKDGFLSYYPETEMKEFTKTKKFNIHPKGIIPLANCEMEMFSEMGHPFCFKITGEDLQTPAPLMISAESEHERNSWIEALRQAARVTWENACMGDSIIRQWEESHSKLERERQQQLNQLLGNSEALVNEQIKNNELERVKEELEHEKAETEKMLRDLQDHCSLLCSQLSERVSSTEEVEKERCELQNQTKKLQEDLQKLAEERSLVQQQLQEQQKETTKLSKEKESLSSQSAELDKKLKQIEEEQKKLLEEKTNIEGNLKNNEQVEELLKEEKLTIAAEVEELQSVIKDISREKEEKEKELKEEMKKRAEAESRLKAAEESLARLEKAIDTKPVDVTEAEETTRKEEMKSDVKTLRKFFENVAFESKVDAQLSTMIKNSLMAKKRTDRQAMSMRLSSTMTLHKVVTNAPSGSHQSKLLRRSEVPGNDRNHIRKTHLIMEPLGEV